MDVHTDRHLRPALLGQLRQVDLKRVQLCFASDFAECCPIFIIPSLTDLAINF